MSAHPLIVGLGGTTRIGSTTERALRIAMSRAEALGARTRLFTSTDLNLAHFDPNTAERGPQEIALVEALRQADGVIIATPSYHGSISGMVKNALDYTEDLRRDARPYLESRAVGCIVCAEGPQAMGATLAALRAIVHALRGWPTPYGAVVNTGGMYWQRSPIVGVSGVVYQLAIKLSHCPSRTAAKVVAISTVCVGVVDQTAVSGAVSL